jgi:hypothetical protein
METAKLVLNSSGVVVDRIMTGDDFVLPGMQLVREPAHAVNIGDVVDVSTLEVISAAPEIVVVPGTITSRQLFIAMAHAELISADEALAAAQTGAIPAVIDGTIATLPNDQQLVARITWARMRDVERANPLVALVGAALNRNAAEIDALFVRAASIP